VADVEHTNDAALWSEIPAFEYRPLSAMTALRSAASPLLALMTWLAAAVVTAAAVSKRARP
jgi:hypothetical protein